MYHSFEKLFPKVVIEDEIVPEVMERRGRPRPGRILLIYSMILIVVVDALGVFGTSLGAYYDDDIASKI